LAKLILNGATSGSISIESPAVSGTTVLTLPTTSGTMLTNASQLVGTGTTTNDSASTGYIGEYIASTVAAGITGLTTATATNATSISLTAGDWDVSGSIAFNFAGTTTSSASQMIASISTTSATNQSPLGGYATYLSAALTTGSGISLPVPLQRITIATTTTVYLVGSLAFAVSTAGIGGSLRARRVR
jgi:hypothetical protein